MSGGQIKAEKTLTVLASEPNIKTALNPPDKSTVLLTVAGVPYNDVTYQKILKLQRKK